MLEPQPDPSGAGDGRQFFTSNRHCSGSNPPVAQFVSRAGHEHSWTHRCEPVDSRIGTEFNRRSDQHNLGREQVIFNLQSQVVIDILLKYYYFIRLIFEGISLS